MISSKEATSESKLEDRKREARGIAVNFLTLLAQAAFPAVQVQLARMLGAEDYGVYAWSSAFVEMFSLVTMFGMDQALIAQVSLAVARKDIAAAAVATGTALRTVAISGICVAAIVFIAAPSIAAWQGTPALVTPLRVLAFEPIAYHLTSIFIVATQSKQIMKYGFWVRGITQPITLLVFTTFALRLNGSLKVVCMSVVAGLALTCTVTIIFYRREFPLRATLATALKGPVDRRLMKFAIPFVLANLAWALQGRVEMFLLGRYRESAEVGIYSACALYAVGVGQVRDAFQPIVCAAIPPALAQGHVRSLNETLQRQTRWIATLAAPICILFIGFGETLLQVFGHDFRGGAIPMGVLSLGQFFTAISISSFTLSMSGNVRYVTLCATTSVVSQMAALPFLLSRYGIVGAAISSAAGMVVTQTLQMALAYRLTGVVGLSWRLLRIILAALIALCVGRACTPHVPGPILINFVVSVAITAIVYLACIAAFGLTTDERSIAIGFIRSKLRRTRRMTSAN